MKKILIYGDSNVWGDNFLTGIRIPDEKQWPNILQNILKDEYKVLQEGLPGRVAGNEEIEKKYKNGKETFLATFKTNAPVDYIIIALGTNDLQIKYDRETEKIVNDLNWYSNIIEQEFQDDDNKKKYFVNENRPKIIYLLPTHFNIKRDNPIFNKNSEIKRQQIIKAFKNNNNVTSYVFNDLSLFPDGIHLNYEGHYTLAKEVANIIKEQKIIRKYIKSNLKKDAF